MTITRTYYIGIDPDVSTTAVATVGVVRDSESNELQVYGVQATVFRAKDTIEALYRFGGDKTYPVSTRVAVESQHVIRGRTKDPGSIIKIAQVAGAAAAWACRSGGSLLQMPDPVEWKGSVPKQVSMERTARALGWDYTKKGTAKTGYIVPKKPGVTNWNEVKLFLDSDWKHLMDAFGLALWLACEHEPGLKAMIESKRPKTGFQALLTFDR